MRSFSHIPQKGGSPGEPISPAQQKKISLKGYLS
jgi:hypothetical protein